MSYSHFFSKNISVYAIFSDQSFNNMLTNIISFEQLGPGIIGLDKSGYKVNSFLISPLKYMLWVLIRGKALLMSTHNMFSWRNKKNINTNPWIE